MYIYWRNYLETLCSARRKKVAKAIEEQKQFHTKSKRCWGLLQILRWFWWWGNDHDDECHQLIWSVLNGDHTGNYSALSHKGTRLKTRWIYGLGLGLHRHKHLDPFRQTSCHSVCDRTITTAHFEQQRQFRFIVSKRRFLVCFWLCF